MLTGALIVESLRVGTVLDDLDLTVRRLSRLAPTGVTADQPAVWTLMEFTSERAEPSGLAEEFSRALDSPGWYASFDSDSQVYVIFPGRIFTYGRDDGVRHEQALAYARSLGIPDEQCDW